MPKALTRLRRLSVLLLVVALVAGVGCTSLRDARNAGGKAPVEISIPESGGAVDGHALPASWPEPIIVWDHQRPWPMTPVSMNDPFRATALWKDFGVDFVWFGKGGTYYVITDPATVKRAQDLVVQEKHPESAFFASVSNDLTERANRRRDLTAQALALQTEIAAEPADKKAELLRRLGDLVHQIAEIDRANKADLDRMAERVNAAKAEADRTHDARRDKLHTLVGDALRDALAKPVEEAERHGLTPPPYPREPVIVVSGDTLTSPYAASEAELIQAWRLRGSAKGDYVWSQNYRMRPYYITDPAAVAQVKSLTAAALDQTTNARRMSKDNQEAENALVQQIHTVHDSLDSLADQDGAIRARMDAASSADIRDRLAKQDADILQQQAALLLRDDDLKSQLKSTLKSSAEQIRALAPFGTTVPTIREALTAAWDQHLAIPAEPQTARKEQ